MCKRLSNIGVLVLLGFGVLTIPKSSASEDPTTPVPSLESSEEVPFSNSTLEHEEDPACVPIFTEPLPEASKKYVTVCYATEAKVSRLLDKISWTVKIMATQGTTLYSEEQQLKNDTTLSMRQIVSICSNRRIESLIDDIGEVAHQLWVLSIRLREPCDSDVLKLDKMKVELIRRLLAVRVYSTKSALSSHPMLLQSYEALLEELEYVFNSAFVMFQTPRPTRPPPLFGPPAAPGSIAQKTYSYDPIVENILQPNNSVTDLLELAREHPKSMKAALPQLVAKWYAGNPSNFQQVLNLINRLPSLGHQILGNAAIHDQLRLHSQLESYELVQLAVQVYNLNTSVAKTAETIPLSLHTKFQTLVRDIGPFYDFIGRTSTCHTKNVAYSRYLYFKDSFPQPGVLYYPFNSYTGLLTEISPSSPSSLFQIKFSSYPLYAQQSSIFDNKRRNILRRATSDVPSDAFKDWKLIPVKGGKYFRVLNAKYDEILFADKTLMDGQYRRVFLAKQEYAGDLGIEPYGDLWTFECTR